MDIYPYSTTCSLRIFNMEKLGKYGVSKGSYSNCTGFKRLYKNGRFSISWNDYPDLPEKAIYWYRIKKY